MEDFLQMLVAPYAETPTHLIILEVIAVVFGIASVLFSRAENILVYPTGIISTSIYVYLLYYYGLYGDMGINAYYFSMSIYGWYRWSTPTKEKSPLKISWAGRKGNLTGLAVLIVSTPVIIYFLDNFTDSTVPYIDGFTTAIFFVGMWFMALKNIENWVYWIIGDLISIPLYHYKGLTLSSIQYVVFLVLAIMGLIEWIQKEKRQNG
ncbi:MAG: nicotinamide riboside transporter PnuC [Bacteroidota bacterium]